MEDNIDNISGACTQAETSAEPKKKRIRRTDEQIAADKAAELENLRRQFLAELEEEGRLKDPVDPDNIHEILSRIQGELRAPKVFFNADGNYPYRSAESILATLKPLLQKYSCSVFFRESAQTVGSLIYITSTLTLTNAKGERVESSAMAAEDQIPRTGMSRAQQSGATTSYCRKYALMGLFALDDSRTDSVSEPDASMAVAQQLRAAAIAAAQKKSEVLHADTAAGTERKDRPKPGAPAPKTPEAAEPKPEAPAKEAPKPEAVKAAEPEPAPAPRSIREASMIRPAPAPAGLPTLVEGTPNFERFVAHASMFSGTKDQYREALQRKCNFSDDTFNKLASAAGLE